MTLQGIDYISYGEQVGYGIASVNYLKALIRECPQLNWKTIVQSEVVKFGMDPRFYEDLPVELQVLLENSNQSVNATSQIIHTTPEHFPELLKKGIQNIGMTVWETDTLPENWRGYLRNLDKIIVPCQWNVDTFKKAKIEQPVYKLPHISEFKGEKNGDNFLRLPDDVFVFLNVSVWESRKNLDLLVKTYLKAFSSKDNVVLILKTSKRDVSRPYYRLAGKKKYIKTKNKVRIFQLQQGFRSAKIIVLPYNLPAAHLKSLYTRANAYVSLCHSEGWGMGQYESAWYSKPVITTGYSGYLDFLNDGNSFLVESKLVDVIPNEWEKNVLEGHQWAEPLVDSAIAQMREVYTNYEAALAKGRTLLDNVSQNFSESKITQSFIDIINA